MAAATYTHMVNPHPYTPRQLCEKAGGEKVDVEEEVELGQEVFVKILTVDVDSQKVVNL